MKKTKSIRCDAFKKFLGPKLDDAIMRETVKPIDVFHIYTAPLQPATRFVDNNISPPITFKSGPKKPWFARCCNVRRIAANLEVQVFYDDVRFWCKKGKGCKR